MREYDLLIIAMRRSGSTMLTRLITHGDQIVFAEPHDKKLAGMITLCDARPGTKCGIKVIRRNNLERVRQFVQERQAIRLVRDMRHVALSLYEWRVDRNHEKMGSLQYIFDDTVDNSKMLISESGRVVHYEMFVADPEYREQVASDIGWSLNHSSSEVAQTLTDLGPDRVHEVGRHLGRVTDNSIKLRERELAAIYPSESTIMTPEIPAPMDEARRSFVTGLVEACRDYQEHFGYVEVMV